MRSQEYPGTFIVIEGADGAGTTTQSKKLAEKLDAHWTSEPTSGKVGQKVEEMIRSDDYSAESIALAFAADRMLHLEEEVIPRLEKGETVVSDRYYYSSVIYQTAFGAEYEWVVELNSNILVPDLAVVLDVSSEEAFSRLRERESDKINPENFEEENQSRLDMFSVDSDVVFENLDFQQEVVRRYQRLDERLEEDIFYVDASKGIEEVFELMREVAEREIDF